MNASRRRADAAENRVRIIEAARAAIVDSAELRLNAVAKLAGVGQGTLYRHFPTREDLLAEVYCQEVEELVVVAAELLTAHKPIEALARWLERVADHVRVKRGVFAAVEAAVLQNAEAPGLGPIGIAVTKFLDAGKTDGTIRTDVDAHDLMILIGYLSRLDATEWDTRAGHLLGIVLAGLRRHG